MHAAVVTDYAKPPEYAEYPDPVAPGPDEEVAEVVAAALHPLVRSIADGSHYTSTGDLPMVPGVDAVVRDADGALHYAQFAPGGIGSLAERAVLRLDRSVPLPEDADAVAVAAGVNAVMSSWLALRKRTSMRPGVNVLVVGATGSAGRAAVQVAQRFGAGTVVAAARDEAALAELGALGADRTLLLDELGEAPETDIVLDYLWGPRRAAGDRGSRRGPSRSRTAPHVDPDRLGGRPRRAALRRSAPVEPPDARRQRHRLEHARGLRRGAARHRDRDRRGRVRHPHARRAARRRRRRLGRADPGADRLHALTGARSRTASPVRPRAPRRDRPAASRGSRSAARTS